MTTLPSLDAIQARADAWRDAKEHSHESQHQLVVAVAAASASVADVPVLVAALRAALAVADQLDRLASRHPDSETGQVETAAAHEIRRAVTAHIDTTPKETP